MKNLLSTKTDKLIKHSAGLNNAMFLALHGLCDHFEKVHFDWNVIAISQKKTTPDFTELTPKPVLHMFVCAV